MSDALLKFTSEMGVELIHHAGTDKTIAQAARVSTLGLDNDREKYVGLVRALIREGHWSPLEHCTVTIAFDVPMFVRDQLVRHRSFNFSVFSLRYSQAAPKFYITSSGRPLVQVGKALDYRREKGSDAQASASWSSLMASAMDSWARYQEMIEAGVANEVARAVLPSSIYTQMWMTGNLRSWLHFFAVRSDEHAQQETREASRQAEEIISGLFPVAHQAWKEA